PTFRVKTDHVLQQNNDGSPDKAAPDRAYTAKNGHEQTLSRMPYSYALRADEVIQKDMQHAGYPGKKTRHRKADSEHERHVVAQSTHAAFAFFDAGHRHAEGRIHKPHNRPHHDGHHDE